MPAPGTALERLGFLTIGLFDGGDPGPFSGTVGFEESEAPGVWPAW